ncbi:hypothetical protein DAT39_001724 [Clarias magur]|uniref:Uncharacterized protein n=1 Tax=Clarias magur TaxID=1594786 RepID=A0A8J4UHI9_CLAMG|nr:hypothetical protein DAT39_001724 [Clarias magur]
MLLWRFLNRCLSERMSFGMSRLELCLQSTSLYGFLGASQIRVTPFRSLLYF